MKNEKLLNLFYKTKFNIQKHSPEILAGVGVVGVVASAIMACKATTKLSQITEKHKKNVNIIHELVDNPENLPVGETYTKEDSQKDLTITYVQTGLKVVRIYAPSVILGALSITCLLSSNNILKQRNASLIAAYATIDSGFKKYRKAVVDRFGEELDKELRYDLKSKEIEIVTTDENGKEKKETQVVTVSDMNPDEPSGYARFFDVGCDNWQKDAEHNLWYLKQQQNYANDILRTRGHLFLNEVYDMLGIPRARCGQMVGWRYAPNDPNHKGDNYVDFGIYNIKNEASRRFVNGDERTILLDFNVDGPILDDILR